jgi:hypothetical protein
VAYWPYDGRWEFADHYPSGFRILLRNSVVHAGELFEVRSISTPCLGRYGRSALWIPRNVTILGEACLKGHDAFQFVAFEDGSQLFEIGPMAFSFCDSLQSIAVPSSVRFLGSHCFSDCKSLGSVTFQQPSKLTGIGEAAFFNCISLNRLFIPASVTVIACAAFQRSAIRSISIEAGSVSFRVLNDLLVDFDVRSLVWVIGSPDSILIPSSIEELRECCGALNPRLRTVEFESDAILRSIGQSAFAWCPLLESICIPSSVEVIPESCFCSCGRLRTVTFGPESKLRRIEGGAFLWCRSLKAVSVPTSVEVIGPPNVTFVPRP